MSRSLKFPVAVHVLVALALIRDKPVSSEVLARSIGTNPVVVRRILQALKAAGLVGSQAGVHGGASLAKAPEEITLLDVHDAVVETEAFQVHGCEKHCWIARGINATVPDILGDAERARRETLKNHTIAALADDVRRLRRDAAG